MLDYKFDLSAASQLKRSPPSGIDIVIAGGGPGGLFAALHCYRKGHNVRVLESGRGYDLNGGYIRIGGSVIDNLDAFPGLREAVDLIDHDSKIVVYSADGEFVSGPIYPPKGGGLPFAGISVHRSALSRLLYEYAQALGLEVQFNTRIASYYEDEMKGGCVSKTGERFEADLVIAADGIGSHSAELVSTEGKNEVVGSGLAIFRSTFPAKDSYKNPEVKKFFRDPHPGSGVTIMMRAQQGYGVIFADDELVSLNFNHPDSGDASERWDQKTIKDAVLAYLEEDKFCQVIRDAVLAAPDDAFFNWRLMFRNPTPNWVSPHGRVVQLGDAAHTYLPSSGNGATQALEDGVCLAACLQLAGKSQVSLAARVYNKLRFERTSCLQKIGFRNRAHTMKSSNEEFKQRKGPIVGKWVTAHDPEAYTYEKYGLCVNHLLMDAPFQNENTPPGHKYVPWTMDDFLNGNDDPGKETGDWS